MESTSLESIKIKGFRSLADVEIKGLPTSSTVLIGPNGSGKSNLFRTIEMIKYIIVYRDLEDFVRKYGGADDQLFGGSKSCSRIEIKIALRNGRLRHECRIALDYAQPDLLKVVAEDYQTSCTKLNRRLTSTGVGVRTGNPSSKSTVALADDEDQNGSIEFLKFFKSCIVHQFHDTSYHSYLKKTWDIDDNFELLPNGENLAPILLRIESDNPDRFESIIDYIRFVIPGFDRFLISESYGKAFLRWKLKGSRKTIGAHLTSDGTLRFFALATLLNLPPDMSPQSLLIDEPEIGLHPFAISMIGELIGSMSSYRQVLVATQSPLLVDEFNLDQIIVFELNNGQTQIRQLAGPASQGRYRGWLKRYSTGELWRKNVFGGRP